MKRLLTAVMAGIVFLGLTACAASPSLPAGSDSAVASAAPVAKAKSKAVAATASKKLTAAQANARRSAENYIEMSGFSRSGLVKQLKFEQYSVKDATIAVDSMKVNWNREADQSAKGYVDMTGFSRAGLIKQLKFEGYTTKQAAHGADSVGL